MVKELIANHEEPFYTQVDTIPDGEGAGLIQAARGALGHWIKVQDNKISQYQIITPTAWNGSPKDSSGIRGPWEQSLMGIAIKDHANPIEAGHIIRSFDPCMVCSVHAVKKAAKR